MDLFRLAKLLENNPATGTSYLEFLRKESVSAGIYSLPAKATDPQKPHTEDEVYFIISGKGFITVGSEEQSVEAGMVIFVGAGVEHRFHSVTETLQILVIFAPAEYSTISRTA